MVELAEHCVHPPARTRIVPHNSGVRLSSKSKRDGRPIPNKMVSQGLPRDATAPEKLDSGSHNQTFVPLPFLAVTVSFFAEILLPYHWELVWSTDGGAKWIQPATLLLAIVSLWSLVEALMASQLRTMAIGVRAEASKYTSRRLFEAIGRRGGFMTLWLTALGAIACAESGDPNIKPTGVLSDMATVGVVSGLTLCIPLALSISWHSYKEMGRAGERSKLAQGLIASGLVGIMMMLAFLGALGQLVQSLRR